MALTKIKLGKYIRLYSERCNIPNLTNDDVSGVNREKEFFEPSNQVGSDTSAYKIVPPKAFACNLMHVGRDKVLPIAYNHSDKNKIVSPAYFVFTFQDNNEILSDYFFIYLKSAERDRYFWFNTDGSIRDGMSWEDFCDIEIDLPPIEIQRKYVAIYKSMVANQQAYEQGLDDLKLTCDAYIENLRKYYPCEEVGAYLEQIKEINRNISCKNVVGLYEHAFRKIDGDEDEDLSRFQIIQNEYIVYPPPHFGNIGTIGLYQGEPALISPMYVAFKVRKPQKLLTEYLFLWFLRDEFLRYAAFASCDSIRDTFDFGKLCEYKIPVPPINIQHDIVDIYSAHKIRSEINERLKAQIKDICPILIKGATEEGKNDY